MDSLREIELGMHYSQTAQLNEFQDWENQIRSAIQKAKRKLEYKQPESETSLFTKWWNLHIDLEKGQKQIPSTSELSRVLDIIDDELDVPPSIMAALRHRAALFESKESMEEGLGDFAKNLYAWETLSPSLILLNILIIASRVAAASGAYFGAFLLSICILLLFITGIYKAVSGGAQRLWHRLKTIWSGRTRSEEQISVMASSDEAFIVWNDLPFFTTFKKLMQKTPVSEGMLPRGTSIVIEEIIDSSGNITSRKSGYAAILLTVISDEKIPQLEHADAEKETLGDQIYYRAFALPIDLIRAMKLEESVYPGKIPYLYGKEIRGEILSPGLKRIIDELNDTYGRLNSYNIGSDEDQEAREKEEERLSILWAEYVEQVTSFLKSHYEKLLVVFRNEGNLELLNNLEGEFVALLNKCKEEFRGIEWFRIIGGDYKSAFRKLFIDIGNSITKLRNKRKDIFKKEELESQIVIRDMQKTGGDLKSALKRMMDLSDEDISLETRDYLYRISSVEKEVKRAKNSEELKTAQEKLQKIRGDYFDFLLYNKKQVEFILRLGMKNVRGEEEKAYRDKIGELKSKRESLEFMIGEFEKLPDYSERTKEINDAKNMLKELDHQILIYSERLKEWQDFKRIEKPSSKNPYRSLARFITMGIRESLTYSIDDLCRIFNLPPRTSNQEIMKEAYLSAVHKLGNIWSDTVPKTRELNDNVQRIYDDIREYFGFPKEDFYEENQWVYEADAQPVSFWETE